MTPHAQEDRVPEIARSCVRPPGLVVENLVFEGGGVKAVAYAGALSVLEHAGLLGGVRRVAGTSAGAITATLVALRYTPDEIRTLMLHTDFARFEDGGACGVFRLFRRYGYYEGEYFLRLMQCLVAQRTGTPDATFRDLERGGFRDLRVFATDLETGEVIEFSSRRNADTSVAEAVRRSMSIPLVFAAVRAGDRLFVDGGVVDNYPITAFDPIDEFGEPKPDGHTLGFRLVDVARVGGRHRIHGVVEYSRGLVEAVLNAQSVVLHKERHDLARTVILNDLGIPATDFQLSEQLRRELVAQGVRCTCDYLREWQPGAFDSTTPVRRGKARRCGWALQR